MAIMTYRRRRVSVALFSCALLIGCYFVATRSTLGVPQDGATLALVGGTIYPSPIDAPITNGVVVIRGGKIAAVGSRQKVRVPSRATILNCAGMFVVAGFQNSHVHFTEPKWEGAATLPAAQLSAQLENMLLRYGFTTVVDTGSRLANTLELRKRIESGEVRGPRILTAGIPLYPQNGIPYYLRESLPQTVLQMLNTPKTSQEAAAIASKQLEAGADAVKLFTGSCRTWASAAHACTYRPCRCRRGAPSWEAGLLSCVKHCRP